MPTDAPKLKLNATKGYGANIVFFDRYKDNVDEVIKKQTAKTGMTFVDPFDDYDIIAGQGSIAVEFLEQVGQLDHLLMGIGGGGIISGCSIASKHL
jgi:threonine dehydratase